MKLEYYWLGLVFIIITHVPHASMTCDFSLFHCCPNHNATYSESLPTLDPDPDFCKDGKEMIVHYCPGTPGIFCKTLNKCFGNSNLGLFPCKISNSEEVFCSNQTEAHNRCRGTLASIAACRK